MMGRAPGAVAAALLSGLAWVVSRIIYGVLKIRYHHDWKILLIFIGFGLVIAALLRWIW